MSLQVNHNGSLLPVRLKELDREKSRFNCYFGEDDSQSFEIPYVLDLDTTYHPSNFQIHFLIKSDVRENDICQVYDKARAERIGWCFPIQALVSKEHSYHKNIFFLRYAYVASMLLFEECPGNIETMFPAISSENSINITEFFHESTVILVICKNKFAGGLQFLLADWLPSFFSYGYVLLTERNPNDLIYKINIDIRKQINVQIISSVIKGNEYIELIFSKLIAYERNTLFCFFYLYQIFEILLEHIFVNEQGKLTKELIASEHDSIKIKGLLAKVAEYSSEKKRLGLLVDKYVQRSVSHGDLKMSCNTFLDDIGSEEGQSLNNFLAPQKNSWVTSGSGRAPSV